MSKGKRIMWGIVALIGVGAALLYGVLPGMSRASVSFTPSGEPFANPLMGYVPWAANQTPENAPEPEFTLAFALLLWSDFEPEKGLYDFESFEKRNNLEHLRSHGVRLVLRFVSDYPSQEKHMDIPEWLYEETGGEFYDNHGLIGFAPDYSDPVLIVRHKLALQALGERYDSSPDIAFVQLGSLGQWGEWHNWASPESPFPDSGVTDIYVSHYLKAFKSKKLQMRRPFEIARQNGIGLYNDMMGHADSTYQWLGWIEDAGMSDFHKNAPSGGEFASTYSLEDYFGPLYEDVKQMIADSHTTYAGGFIPGGFEENGGDLLMTMGYRFKAIEARFKDKPRSGSRMTFELDVENEGIAPFYYDWEFRLLFYGSGGELAYDSKLSPAGEYVLPWDVRSIQAGETVTFTAEFPLELPQGEYSVKLELRDGNAPVERVRFANLETGGDKLLNVGNITVGRWFLWM